MELPQIIGDFCLLEPLGQGAMGVVYRARHRQTGALVALKTLPAPRERLLQSLRREIQALARMRHPGIVRILGEGLHEGIPWYAMELLEGVPLQNAVLHEKPLAQRLTLVRRLCFALAYLHGEGIVHRDLKPANVMVQAGRQPVLLDFGLATRFAASQGREFLEIDAAAAGTVAYMAPEQGRGRLVDARADLYSLGCLLHELLAGRPPFSGKTPSEVLWQHFEAEPLPPSRLAPEIAPELDALVLRLLAKEPRDRFGHASDVAASLLELGAESEADAGPLPRSYLYRPGLAGRTGPLRELERYLAQVQGGHGVCVLLGGESGIGKTRVAMELARQAERYRVRVLSGEALPSATAGALGARGPLHPLLRALQVLADRCRERGQPETERLLGDRGKLLVLYEPALAGLPGLEALPDPVELPPEAAKQRLFSALADTFAAWTQGGPLLLILDDLQWADGLTVDWLSFLLRTRRLEAMPLLILGTYRLEEWEDRPQAALLELGAHRVLLGRLDEPAIGSMVGDMLALDPPPSAFVRYLARQSEGHPFFVAETLRTAVDEGILFRDLRGRWQVAQASEEPATPEVYEALPLPDSLRELVARRLDGLSEAGRRLVEAAAILGRKFSPVGLAALSGEAAEGLAAPLHDLLRRQVLEELPGGNLHFVHDRIREVALERLPQPRQQQLHQLAAESIEALPEADRQQQLAALGRHREGAGQPVLARQAYFLAATRAQARHAYPEAEGLYRDTLRLWDQPDPQSIEAWLSLAQPVLHVLGRHAEAMASAQTALEQAKALDLPALQGVVLRKMGVLNEWVGRLDRAATLYQEALETARQCADHPAEAHCLSDLGNVARRQGRVAEARSHLEAALGMARRLGDRRSEGIFLGNLAGCFSVQSLNAEAQDLFEQALAIHRQEGNLWHEELTLRNLAQVALDQGALGITRGFCEQALELQERLGVHLGRSMTLAPMAYTYYAQGQLGQARSLLHQSVEAARQSGNRNHEGLARSNLGMICGLLGQVPEALAMLQEALRLLHGLSSSSEVGTLMFQAELVRRTGDLQLAAGSLQQAKALLTGANASSNDIQFCCQKGFLELAHGRAARDQLEQAQQLSKQLGIADSSETGKSIHRLKRAVEAFEAGKPLLHGEVETTIPVELRRWLIQHRLETAARPTSV